MNLIDITEHVKDEQSYKRWIGTYTYGEIYENEIKLWFYKNSFSLKVDAHGSYTNKNLNEDKIFYNPCYLRGKNLDELFEILNNRAKNYKATNLGIYYLNRIKLELIYENFLVVHQYKNFNKFNKTVYQDYIKKDDFDGTIIFNEYNPLTEVYIISDIENVLKELNELKDMI